MEESMPASLLVLAGLLRLAGVSQSEPWSSYPPDPVFLEEELVTTKTRPVSVSEGDTTEATLQFDSFTSNLANGVVSHSHAASGTQAEGITDGKDQLLTSLGTARLPERSAQSLDAATAWPQSDAPFASKPLTSTSALTGEPESKVESASLSKHSAEFLPREERTGHSTAWELMSVERSTPHPSKLSSSVELLATLMLKSDSSESAKQPVTSGTSLSQATATGNLHTLTSIGNQTEAEELHGEIVQTSAKESLLEKLPTLIPKSSQHSQVKSQPAKPDIGSSDVLLTHTPQSPLGKVSFSMISRQTLSEEDVASLAGTKMTQHSSFASSPHGEMKEHNLTDRAKTENPTLLAPSRSNARPLPFLSTPGTLSLKTSSLPAFSGDIGQSSLSKLVFSSQFPRVSKSAASTNTEQRFRERTNLTLHHEIDPQTQASHFKLSQMAAFFGGPLPVSQMKEATIVVSVPADSKSQPSGILPPVRGKPRLRVPGITPTANLISSRVRPTTLAMAAPSKVGSPSPVVSAAAPAGGISQFLANVQLPATPSSVYGEQPLPSTLVPSLLLDPEPAAISSAPTNQPTPDVPRGLKRPASPAPPHTEPVVTSALTHTKSPSPGNSAPWHSGLNTSAVIDSAPSRLTPPALSTLADGELQESVFGRPAPYHAEQRLLGNSASTPARSTAAGASSPPVEPDAPGVVARLSVAGTSALNHPRQKPSAVLPVHAKTASLLAHICAKSQPAAMPVPAGGEEPSVSIPDMHVPSHVTSHVPGSSASFMDEPSLLVTSVPTHAKPKINEAPAESRLPISTPVTPQRTGVSVSTLIQIQSLLFSAHAPTVQSLSGVSAELGALLHNETRTPDASSSPAVYIQSADVAFRGQLKPEASSSSALVDTSSQSPGTSSSAHTGTQTPVISTSVHPGLQRHATTPIQSGMPHAPEKEREGKHSPQSSPLTSPSGTYRAALPSVSPLPLRRSSPRLGSPASLVSHRNASNLLPLVSGALVEGSLPGLRTTPMLAVPDAQDRMSSSLGFIQHRNRSDVTTTRSLDSLAAEGYLRMPFSLHYLSFLARNAENLVCLQPTQDTTTSPPSGEPNASGRVASTQEMLLLSSSLGFSHLGASGLVQMSPSNVILVKPVLVFWPADKPDIPMLSPTEEEAEEEEAEEEEAEEEDEDEDEEEEEEEASLPFTNKTVLGLVTLGGSQEQPMETRPTWSTIRNPTEKQVISGPVFNASPKYIAEASWVRSNGVTTVPSRSGLKELSTTTKSLKSQDQGEEFPTSALDLQGLEENNPALLPVGTSVEHQGSVAPPVVVSLQQRLKSLPATTSLYSMTERSASQRLTSSLPTSRATERPLQVHRRVPVLHTETHPHGSLTPSTSIGKNIEGPLSASSAGNVELPLETGQEVTRSRPPSPGSSSTKLTGKLPRSMQAAVPSLVPDFPKLSSEQKHKESEALNHSYSEAALPFPMATEMPSYRGRATSSQPSKRNPKSPLANEGLRSPLLFTLFSADTRIPTTGGREDGVNHQMLSRPPADVSLHLSISSFFTKSAPKHSLTTLMVSGTRASLANLEGHIDAEETNKSVRVPEIRSQTEATSFKPTMFGRDSGHLSTLPVAAELNSTAGSSSDSRQAADVQRGVNPFSPAPLLAPNSARRDLAVSPMGGKISLWETAHGNLHSGTSKEGDTLLKQRGREQDGTSAHLRVTASFRPQPVSLEGDHLGRPRLLDDDQTPEAGSSLPRPGRTPSSAVSIVLKASTFLMTTLSSGAAAGGVGWISDQTSQTLPLDTSETFLNLHTQSRPTLESLSDASAATAEQDLLVEATGELTKPGSYTTGEQAAGMKDATEGAEDPVSPRLPQDPDRKAHHRRLLRSDDNVFLDGFAVVSDDACSSGNYSTAMSLRPGAVSSAPSSPDSFLALIAVQDSSSSSQPTLRIRSCCVTPTSRPTGPDAACCLFPRPPLECGHIQFHQNRKSDRASFTIQLFQMLNHSVAYLHCELSICLSRQGVCEQGCLENRETLSRPSDRSSYRTRHNLISFGPVWKAQTEFPAGSAAGSALAATPLLLLGSFTATALFVGVAIFIWLQRKCKTKMAAHGSDGP